MTNFQIFQKCPKIGKKRSDKIKCWELVKIGQTQKILPLRLLVTLLFA